MLTQRQQESANAMFVSYTRPIDHYEGTKNWNELTLAERQKIIALEFGSQEGDLESFMISTDLKKAQYRGLRGLSVHARMALENAGKIRQNSDDLKDSVSVINYYSGTNFHAEMLALLKGEGSTESSYDGMELEKFGFASGNRHDPLDDCFEMDAAEARRYVLSLLRKEMDQPSPATASRVVIDSKKAEALKAALTQIEKKFGTGSVVRSGRVETTTSIHEDTKLTDTHGFTQFSAANSSSLLDKIKHIFDCAEVRWVKQEIEHFFHDTEFLTKKFFLAQALRLAGDADRVKYSISVDRLAPKQIALIIIRNIALERLTSGHEHIYRGVLSLMGQDFLAVFRRVVACEVALGYSSVVEAEKDISDLNRQIREVG